ncbi:hypothetical protein [Geodermatophilus sp. SYSU D00700]
MGKLSMALGLGVGYVLGTRAGRERYEQIAQAATRFMGRPEVQQTLEKARDAAPPQLQSSIDKLTGQASGGQGPGGQSSGTQGAGSQGAGSRGTDVGTVGTGTTVDPVVPLEADVVVPPSPPVGGAGDPGLTDPTLPDPLVPPAKSDGSPGRP